jgi:tRNA-modifying protein YgfZ
MSDTGYQALRNGAAYLDLSSRGKLKASGEDRVRLLHAMSTNHVQNLAEGEGLYTFFLNAQGRVLADAHLFSLPEYLLLDVEPSARQPLFEHLDKFIIADDVTIEDVTAHLATIGVDGPTADEVLQSAGLPVPAREHAIEAFAFQGPSGGDKYTGHVARVSEVDGGGVLLFVPAEAKTELLEKLESAGAVEASEDDAAIVRAENLRPRFGVDFGDQMIAHETGLVPEAIHFSKGCYLGQEIVERVRARGHVNKKLYPFELEAETAPESGTKILSDEKEVGQVTSALFSPGLQKVVGFAIVRTEAAARQLTIEGAALTLRETREAPAQC